MSSEKFTTEIEKKIEDGYVLDMVGFQSEFFKLLIRWEIISEDESGILGNKLLATNLASPRGQELIKKINTHFNVEMCDWASLNQGEFINFVKSEECSLSSKNQKYLAFEDFFGKILSVMRGDGRKRKARQFCLEYLSQ
ncbi:hypothetical protein OAG24_00580 [bacterium]|nr:hypothetical protein [bacterium]